MGVDICSSKKCLWKGVDGWSAKSMRIDQAGNTSSGALTATAATAVYKNARAKNLVGAGSRSSVTFTHHIVAITVDWEGIARFAPTQM
ncbi:MAG: hypothetical protein L6R36_000498 [Xanthoria steineri]|nr:MAG: hypothetical protein L6R36_000498 [Xanthoria steineri]